MPVDRTWIDRVHKQRGLTTSGSRVPPASRSRFQFNCVGVKGRRFEMPPPLQLESVVHASKVSMTSWSVKRRMPKHIPSQLGARIRKLRQKQGVSLEQLAKQSGVNWHHLGVIERGSHNVRLSTLTQLVGPLGTTLALLFRGIETNWHKRRRNK